MLQAFVRVFRAAGTACAIGLLIVGCDGSKQRNGSPPATGSADTLATIKVNTDGSLRLVDENGEPLPVCRLCTPADEERYGLGCAGIKKVDPPPPEFCLSTIASTAVGLDSLALLRSTASPICPTWSMAGTLYQSTTCICKAGDVAPPGKKCRYI